MLPVAAAAYWNAGLRREADVPGDVGEDDVLLRRMELAQCFAGGRGAVRVTHAMERVGGAVVRPQGRPRQGEHGAGFAGVVGHHVAHHRPMPGLAHDQAHRLAAAYADELVVHLERSEEHTSEL